MISRFPILINIPMRIQYLDVYYEEKASDPSGAMTLGDLAELLTVVHSRSKEQHQALADAFQTTGAGQDVAAAQKSHQCHVS